MIPANPQKFHYVVTVIAEDEEQADQIMAERINHDEDLSEYGIGDYQISFRKPSPGSPD